MKSRGFLVKVFMSAAIIAALVTFSDIELLSRHFLNISYGGILVSVFMLILVRIIMAYRWKLLLAYGGTNLSYFKLLEVLFVSNAVGHFLPGGVGGDVVRIIDLSRGNVDLEKVFASVLLDRIIGIISMLLMAVIMSWYAAFLNMLDINIAMVLTVLLLGLPSVYVGFRLILSSINGCIPRSALLARLVAFYRKVSIAITEVNIAFSNILLLLACSLLVQILRSLAFVGIFFSIGAEVEVVYSMVFIPVVFILMLMPISIGGLGVREASLFALLGSYGLTVESSTAAGLIFHALQLVLIIPGVALLLLRKQ